MVTMVSIPAHLRLARMEEGEMLGGEAPQKDSSYLPQKRIIQLYCTHKYTH